MARKTKSQSVDQVPLPFDDLFHSEANAGNGAEIAVAEPPKSRRKPREKRALPASDTGSPAPKETSGAAISETLAIYQPMVISGTITWETIELCAAEVLTVWNDGSELDWAEGAWNTLAQAGLTSYTHAVEYHQVIFRFFAVCSLYLDFSRIAWDQGGEIPYAEWAAYFKLSELRVGQLLGTENRWEEGSAGSSLFESALHSLTIAERPWVLKIIRRSFGGTSKLFDSLWATRLPLAVAAPTPKTAERSHRPPQRIWSSVPINEDEDSDHPLFDEDSLDEPDAEYVESEFVEDDFTAEKQRALEWLHTGCR